MNTIPRRIRLDLNEPSELAIHNAIQEIENMAADERLTKAVILLGQAKDFVSDYIDDHQNLNSTPMGGLYEQLESIDNYLNGGGRINGNSQLHRDIKETIKNFKPIKVKIMDKTILFVGFNPDGEADFAVSGLVNKLSVEEMNRLRQMIVVSIGRLEELWRLNFNRVRTDGNATSTVHFGGHTSANNPELPKNLNQ